MPKRISSRKNTPAPTPAGNEPKTILDRLTASAARDTAEFLREYRELLAPGAPADDGAVAKLRDIAVKLGRDVKRIRKDAAIVERAHELHVAAQRMLPVRSEHDRIAAENDLRRKAIDEEIRRLQHERTQLIGATLQAGPIHFELLRAREEILELRNAHGELIDPALVPET